MTTSLRVMAARGVVWSTLQNWGVRLMTAMAFIVISRQLQPAEFGLVALAMSILAVLTLIGDVGMANYLVRKPEIDRSDTNTAFWTSIALASTIALVLAATAPLLSHLFGEPGMTPLLWALCGGLVIAGAASVPTTLLKRDLAFKTLALRATTATLIGSAVAIGLALLGAGAWALIVQSLVRGSIAAVTSFAASGWRPSFTYSRDKAGTMLKFGGTLLSIDLLIQARDRGEDFVLAAVNGAATLGLWSVASRLVRIIQETGSSVVSAVATPAFAKVQGDRKRLHRGFEVSLYTTGAVMFPPLLLLAVISPDLIPLLLGRQWTQTADVAQVIALTTAFAVFTYFDRAIFIAVGRLRPEVLLVSGIVALHLGLVLLFADQGLLVLAFVLLARVVLFIPIRGYVLHRVTGMPFRAYFKVSRVLAAALTMGLLAQLSILAIDSDRALLRSLVAAGVCLLAYPPLLWLLARPVVTSIVSDLRSVRGGRRRPPPVAHEQPSADVASPHPVTKPASDVEEPIRAR